VHFSPARGPDGVILLQQINSINTHDESRTLLKGEEHRRTPPTTACELTQSQMHFHARRAAYGLAISPEERARRASLTNQCSQKTCYILIGRQENASGIENF
jgi:hypothetical protein